MSILTLVHGKSNLLKNIIHYGEKGRVAYLLKSSKSEKAPRKSARVYATDLQILKGESHEEEKNTNESPQIRRSQTEDVDMNVDARQGERYFHSSNSSRENRGTIDRRRRGTDLHNVDHISF